MVAIPSKPEQALGELIYSAYEGRAAARRKGISLARLGASSIADPCLRRTFLDWRAYARGSVSGQVQRLFETGHLQEARVVADLRMAGLEVWDRDASGRQFEWSDPGTGHFVVKVDGVVRGVPGAPKTAHLLEIKTHNDKNWNILNKSQDVSASFPEHFVQCQVGMWGMKLERALYVAINKDNEAYYFERIRRDAKPIKWVEDRVDKLYVSDLIPAGVSADATGWECTKYGGCTFRDVCLGGQPLKNCRTCRHVETGPDGAWLCNLHEKVLGWDEQRAACGSWDPLKAEPLPGRTGR